MTLNFLLMPITYLAFRQTLTHIDQLREEPNQTPLRYQYEWTISVGGIDAGMVTVSLFLEMTMYLRLMELKLLLLV